MRPILALRPFPRAPKCARPAFGPIWGTWETLGCWCGPVVGRRQNGWIRRLLIGFR